MRDKEVKQDYRFMPEPNLTPLHVYQSIPANLDDNSPTVIVEELQKQLPKLPAKLREYLVSEFDCSLFQAGFIVVLISSFLFVVVHTCLYALITEPSQSLTTQFQELVPMKEKDFENIEGEG